MVSSGWLRSAGSPALRPEDVGTRDQALAPQEADGELILVTGRAHRDRDGDRILARTGGADLQGGLADHAIVAKLERLAANGHDPDARDVADGFEALVGHGVADATVRPVGSSPSNETAGDSPCHQA